MYFCEFPFYREHTIVLALEYGNSGKGMRGSLAAAGRGEDKHWLLFSVFIIIYVFFRKPSRLDDYLKTTRKLLFKNNDFIVPESNGVAEYKFEEKFWSRRDVECKKEEVWKQAKINNFSKTKVVGEYLHVNIFGAKSFKDYKLRWRI